MTSDPRILERLKEMQIFSEFNQAEIETFCELAEIVSAGAGECIVRQDETGDSMFVLLTGQARVIHRKEGQRIELATLQPGDFFGELGLVDEGPRSADVEAVDACTLARIPQSMIRALAGVFPSAAFKLLVAVGRVMVDRMRKSNRKYIDSILFTGANLD